jgi:hypothetical protein
MAEATIHYIRTPTRQQEADLLLADFQRLRSLRREARNTINRLIDFLDRSDPYVQTELEDDDDCDREVYLVDDL